MHLVDFLGLWLQLWNSYVLLCKQGRQHLFSEPNIAVNFSYERDWLTVQRWDGHKVQISKLTICDRLGQTANLKCLQLPLGLERQEKVQ